MSWNNLYPKENNLVKLSIEHGGVIKPLIIPGEETGGTYTYYRTTGAIKVRIKNLLGKSLYWDLCINVDVHIYIYIYRNYVMRLC